MKRYWRLRVAFLACLLALLTDSGSLLSQNDREVERKIIEYLKVNLKAGQPVILNLQSTDTDLSKRLIDFASGLTYALDGGMQRIADKVFLLTPRNVEVSAEERARLIEKGFFNQS